MPVTSASDADLIAASRRGEHAAFGALVERYQHTVCAVGYSRTGDRALSEDVARDTFLAAWHQLDELSDPAKLRPWLCGIARHLAARARRRTGRETPVTGELLSTAAAADNPFLGACDAESERTVWRALGRIPETYREALVTLLPRASVGADGRAHASRSRRPRSCNDSRAAARYLAANVTAMVEHSLRARRGRRRLAAAVLAALPHRPGHVARERGDRPIQLWRIDVEAWTVRGRDRDRIHRRVRRASCSTARTTTVADSSPASAWADDEPSPVAAIRASAVRPPALPPASTDTCVEPKPSSAVVLDRETRAPARPRSRAVARPRRRSTGHDRDVRRRDVPVLRQRARLDRPALWDDYLASCAWSSSSSPSTTRPRSPPRPWLRRGRRR